MAKKIVHLIANAHLDPVWLWRWQEGYAEVLATYRSALDRLKEYPELRFTSACACYYEWIEEACPEMAAEIKERVAEGRWEITGGWYIQPDCNIPSGESFARHTLISQNYFKEKFGVSARTGYNVDSFGHNGAIPKILRAGGMDRYVFMRPGEEEKELPDAFRWRSDDGSEVTAYRIPIMYCISPGREQHIDTIAARMADGRERMAFVGVGNHGGGPTVRLIESINARNDGSLRYSTTDAYFSALDGELPVVSEELQHHAIGCYSAVSEIKKNNALCEAELYCAEALSVMAGKLLDDTYPAEKYERAWKNVLFNQFHDIMCGCAIKSAYDDARLLHHEALSIAEREINLSMQRIAQNIDTVHGDTAPPDINGGSMWRHATLGSPVVVFNANPFETEGIVKIDGAAVRVVGPDGEEMLTQRVRAERTNCEDDKWRTAFCAKLPAFGYRVYRAFFDGESKTGCGDTFATEKTLENDILFVEFDEKSGEIATVIDKRSGKRLIDTTLESVLLDETDCDTWAHNKITLGKRVGSFGKPQFRIIENGPLRATVEITQLYGKSTLTRRYSLVKGSRELRADTVVDFHEKHRTLKLCLPCGEGVTAAIPYGTTDRKTIEKEFPFSRWLSNGTICAAFDSKYGYDCADGFVRITALRSPVYADHFGKRDELCEYTEQGKTEFSYVLFAYEGKADAQRRCDSLVRPLRTVNTSFHGGRLPESYSAFESDTESAVIVSAIKRSRDGEATIIRFSDYEGRAGAFKAKFFGKELATSYDAYALVTLKDNKRVNLLEE